MMESLVEIATCHVCLRPLDSPRRLPCPHSFCTSCIRTIVEQTAQPAMGAPKLKCPECRAEHVMPLGGVEAYPLDVKLQELVRSIQKRDPRSDDLEEDGCAGGYSAFRQPMSNGGPRSMNADAFRQQMSNGGPRSMNADAFRQRMSDSGPQAMREYAFQQQTSNVGPGSMNASAFQQQPMSNGGSRSMHASSSQQPMSTGGPRHQSERRAQYDPRAKLREEINQLKSRVNAIGNEKIAESKGKWIRAEINLAEVRCQVDEQFQIMDDVIQTLPLLLEERRLYLQKQLDPKQMEVQQNIAVLDEVQDMDTLCQSLDQAISLGGDVENVRALMKNINDRVADLDKILALPVSKYKYKFDDGEEPQPTRALTNIVTEYGHVLELNKNKST